MRSALIPAVALTLAACSPLVAMEPPPSSSSSSTGGGGAAPDPALLPLACDAAFADAPTTSAPTTAVWARLLPGLADRFLVALDGAGNLVAQNEFHATADFGGGVVLTQPPDAPGFGQYLAKLAPTGDVLWARETSPYLVRSLSAGDGGVTWTRGFTVGPGASPVRRWDAGGELAWEKSWSVDAHQVLGLRGDRVLVTFALGDVPLDYGAGTLARAAGHQQDAAVVALDAAGSPRWARSFADADDSSVSRLAAAPDGGAFLLIDARSDAHRELALVRLDADGAASWTRRFPGPAPHTGVNLVSGPSGEVLLQLSTSEDDGELDVGCGTKTGRATVLIALAPDGGSAWTRRFPGITFELRAAFDPAGNVVLSGLAVAPCDLGGGEFIPPITGAGRLVVAELGPDGSHHRSEVIGGAMTILDDNPFRGFVDAAGDLLVAEEQFQGDTGLGVTSPDGKAFAYVTKIHR